MAQNADTSGSFHRPTLLDYLTVLEHETLELCLEVHVGALEIGLVGVQRGAVVHAQLPGASGPFALQLLAKLPNTRLSPQRWRECEANVSAPWRELLEPHPEEQPAGRRQRLSLVRAELRELDAELAAESGVYEIPRPEPGPVERKALDIVGRLFDWCAIDSYLEGEIEVARALVQRRGQIQADILALANLERLRLRLLEDELTAKVEELSP